MTFKQTFIQFDGVKGRVSYRIVNIYGYPADMLKQSQIKNFQISLNFIDGNEAYQMFKLIIEKIKRKSQKKKRKSEPAVLEESQESSKSKEITNESEYSEADEEAIRVQLWRDAQVGFEIILVH